jgi:RNA polymerase sigma-70 factor (ECF subfamily)
MSGPISARRQRRNAASADDAAADFSIFFRREYLAVLRTVVLVVRDRARAEEVTQEAFMQLLRHWKRVSAYDRPDAWVRRVAVHQAMRHMKREHLRAVLERRTLTPGASEEIDRELDQVLSQLSTSQRTALVLHYYEDQPIDEVASLMGCSQNTVKSHLRRGRLKVRALLDDRSGDAS